MYTAMGVVARRVLIVDDNVELAENIAEILQLDGHLTQIASSAEAGAMVAQETAPDVLVTDYRLPGRNGAELVRQLRASRLTVHAIVMSAYTDDGIVRQAEDAGATFMAKPLDFMLLSRRVREGIA